MEATLGILLAAGCGGLIQFLFRNWLEGLQEAHKPDPSPFTKRWMVIGLCVVVPTFIYGVLLVSGVAHYDVLAHFAYMGTAYTATQGLHSTSLSKEASPPGPLNDIQ